VKQPNASPYNGVFETPEFWFPGYAMGQRVAAEALRDILFPPGRDAPFDVGVKRIIDVGCGDGSLLRDLAVALLDKGLAPELFGLDEAPEAIRRANDTAAGVPRAHLTFALVENEAESIARLRRFLDAQPESTAVLFAGHTWFHFLDQRRLLKVLKKRRPAMVLIDIHKDWDADITCIGNQPMVEHYFNRIDLASSLKQFGNYPACLTEADDGALLSLRTTRDTAGGLISRAFTSRRQTNQGRDTLPKRAK